MAENIEVVEQAELVEKKELSELMKRDYAAENLYDEYNTQKIKADVARHEDMKAYYEGKCEELVKEKAAELEQLELTQEERDALIERYHEICGECLKEGKGGLYNYYHDSIEGLREEKRQEGLERSQKWYKEFIADNARGQAELNASIQRQREWKAVHFAPTYTGETGSHVYRYDAQKEYEKNGESFRFKELMEQAAAQELHEKYPEVFK